MIETMRVALGGLVGEQAALGPDDPRADDRRRVGDRADRRRHRIIGGGAEPDRRAGQQRAAGRAARPRSAALPRRRRRERQREREHRPHGGRRQRARRSRSRRPTSQRLARGDRQQRDADLRRDDLLAVLVRRDNTAPTRRARSYTMAEGSWFTSAEVQNHSRVLVVGPTVVSELFNGADPVGQTVQVNGTNFQVIGVTNSKGSNGTHRPGRRRDRAPDRGTGHPDRVRERSARSSSRPSRAVS